MNFWRVRSSSLFLLARTECPSGRKYFSWWVYAVDGNRHIVEGTFCTPRDGQHFLDNVIPVASAYEDLIDGVALLSEQACSSRTPLLHPFSHGFTSMVVALGSAKFDSVAEFEAIRYWSIAAERVCGRLHLSYHVRTFGIRALWNEFRLRVGEAVAAGLDTTSTSVSVSYEPTHHPLSWTWLAR